MSSAGKPLRSPVLIVDDMEINVEILADMIEQLGYQPLPAGSVEEALTVISQIMPQLILLDVSMPEIDGYEFCTILKQNPLTKEIPVIFISALDSLEDKLKGLELGGVDFITKPFEITEVTVRVKNQMENYHMKQELESFNHRLHKMLSDQTQKIERERQGILCSLARLIEERNGASEDHLDNVGYNSRILAQSLQLSALHEAEITGDFIEWIETAAKLHDLGMLWEDNRASHTEAGVTTLSSLMMNGRQSEWMCMALDIIRFHHTDWKDAMPPLSARIVRLAHDFDTFTGKADVPDPWSVGLEAIKAGSGTTYDPQLTEIFLKIRRQLRVHH